MSWNHNTPKDRALAAADALEAELNALPKYSYEDPAPHKAAVADLVERLKARKTDRPTTITNDWKGARFNLLGFRATSTSSLVGAMRNWISQVRKKARVAG